MIRVLMIACCLLVQQAWSQVTEVSQDFQGLRVNALYQPKGDKPVVLILHGTLAHNNMDLIQGLREALTEAGFPSLSMNLSLGIDNRHGMYDCTQPHRHQHADALLELRHWVEWLKTRGHQQIVALGHSRGGNQLAMYLANTPDAAVKAGVLLAPATWDHAQMLADFDKRFGKALPPLVKKAQDLVDRGKGDQWLEGAGLLYCAPGKVTAASFLSYYRNDPQFHTPNLFKAIHMPLLVIAGSEDKVVSNLDVAFGAAETLDQQQLLIIDGADHFFLDLYAYDVVEAMVEFLDAEL